MVDITSHRINMPNLLKMLYFLGQSSYRIPSRGIAWPTALTEKFGEDFDLYLETDGRIKMVRDFPFRTCVDYIDTTQFLLDRCFWSLIDDCIKKIHRVSSTNNSWFPYLKSLLYRFYYIQFVALYDYSHLI